MTNHFFSHKNGFLWKRIHFPRSKNRRAGLENNFQACFDRAEFHVATEKTPELSKIMDIALKQDR